MANEGDTKLRYRARDNMAIGETLFQRGELIDTDQVAASTLKELYDQAALDFVDTLAWNPEGDGGRGAWEAQPVEVVIEAPAEAKTDKTLAGGKVADAPVDVPSEAPASDKKAGSDKATAPAAASSATAEAKTGQ